MTPPATIQTADPTNPDLLLDVILGLLAPLLMSSGITDASLARLAAQQAIAAYKAAGGHDVVCIAQIVGFAVTALDNLRLSMPADLSLSMKLKLRGNANALTRSSQHASAILQQQRREAPTAQHQPPAATPQAQPPAPAPATPSVAAMPTAPAPTTHRQPPMSWASAMTDIAAECAAELPHLPASQRQAKRMQISALTRTVDALHQAATPLRSRLLGSTSLQGCAPRPPSECPTA